MSVASAAAAPAPAAMPTPVVPTADEVAAVPEGALATPELLSRVAAFYRQCLSDYDARNHQGASGRKTACDTHRVYAIAELTTRCAVRDASEREAERGKRMNQ